MKTLVTFFFGKVCQEHAGRALLVFLLLLAELHSNFLAVCLLQWVCNQASVCEQRGFFLLLHAACLAAGLVVLMARRSDVHGCNVVE